MLKYVNFSSVVTTSTLPSRVSEVIVAAAIEQLKEIKNLRQYGLVDNVNNPGAKTYIFNTYDDLTAAYDRSELEAFKYDAANATETTKSFVEIAKGFQLSWEADHLSKLAIRAAQTKAAVREVQDREDYKIAQALIESGALTSSVSATAALSETSADPVKDIAQAKRKVRNLGYTPDMLLIEEQNLEELLSIIASNTWYETTAKAIMAGTLDKFMGLKIVSLPSSKLTHGTAVVMKSGVGGVFQLGVAQDVQIKIFDDNDTHSTKVQVYERICPAVVRPDAGAKITGW